jgi:hypothetical protein
MMDWTLWMLAALALASAFWCAQAVRARLSPRRNGAVVLLAVAALLVVFALTTYFQGASRIADILQTVADGSVRASLQTEARSELAIRAAFSIALAMPALVFGIGFLGPKREAPKG